jgi:tetratricopeptide (TPR) repeat protein
MADVYASDLKEYDTALSLYEQVLKDYPESSEIGTVYKHLAMMQENRKLYDSALSYYNKAIEKLGTQPVVYEAWQGKTDVLVKTKQYGVAYDTLNKGAEVVSTDENKYVAMLTRAADLAENKLKNPALQTAALEKILLKYPQTRTAPEVIYQAAASYEKQEKTEQAVQLYKRLVINYPTEKYAAKAQKRLSKLEK